MLNNQPLIYIEEDIQIPVLMPNTLLYRQPIIISGEWLDEDTPEIKRRQRYINKGKEAVWKNDGIINRWKKEYLRSLRERHNMMHNTKAMKIEVGDDGKIFLLMDNFICKKMVLQWSPH